MRRVLPAFLLLLACFAPLSGSGRTSLYPLYNAADELLWDHDTVANSTANFTYDGAGNRIKELLNTATVPTYTVATNLTTAQFAQSYANEIDYAYDEFNRLDQVTLKGNYSVDLGEEALVEDLFYRYDYQNRRVQRGDEQLDWSNLTGSPIDPGVNQVWQEVYDADGPVRDNYASLSGNWTLGIQEDWVRGSDWGGGIGGVLYVIPNGGNGTNTAKYYNYDGRGDVVALTSNTGNITYAAAYNAYGQHATVTAGNVTTTGTQEVGTDTDLFRLTTKEEDPFGGSYQINRELSLADNTWTHWDPEGLATEADYNEDISEKQAQIRSDEQGYLKDLNAGKYGDPNSSAAVSKYNAACDTSEKGEKYWIDQDKAAIANIEATAKFANDQAKQQLYKASELDDGLHPSWNVDHENRAQGQQEYSVIQDRMNVWKNMGANLATMLTPGGEEEEGLLMAKNGIKSAESSFSFDTKIAGQLEKRGWNTGTIDDVIAHPVHESPAINKATGGDATAFFRADKSYVVRDNTTGKIIQVSNRNDPNWAIDSTITNPPK
jgi:hypothetical protein